MRSERASLTPHVIIEGDDDMRARNYEKMEKSMDWWGGGGGRQRNFWNQRTGGSELDRKKVEARERKL